MSERDTCSSFSFSSHLVDELPGKEEAARGEEGAGVGGLQGGVGLKGARLLSECEWVREREGGVAAQPLSPPPQPHTCTFLRHMHARTSSRALARGSEKRTVPWPFASKYTPGCGGG